MKIALLTTDNREHYKDYGNPKPYFGAAPEALLQGLAQIPELEVHVISCARQPMSSPKKIEENIWFHSLVVPKRGWMTTAYQGCIRAVRRLVKTIKPDLVHGQGSERECAISAVLSGFPNVVTIHGNMAELARLFKARPFSYHWLAARLETFCLRRTAGVFCNSAYTESLVRSRARQTWQVPNAIRMEFFGPPSTPLSESSSGPESRCTIVNVGLVSPRKRQLELLKVIEALGQKGLEFQFLFVGDVGNNPYGKAFLEKIKPLEAEGFARYVGPQDTASLVSLFDSANGMVHFPSEEAFGLVVAEGLARNLKFFGSRLGGIIDITQKVEDADLFDAQDFRGLSEALAGWIATDCPRSREGEKLMRIRYHPQIIASRHLQIYDKVLGIT